MLRDENRISNKKRLGLNPHRFRIVFAIETNLLGIIVLHDDQFAFGRKVADAFGDNFTDWKRKVYVKIEDTQVEKGIQF